MLAHDEIVAPAESDKGAAELTVAPTLLARLAWQDRVLTGDALFCQRDLCQQVCDAGGDYLVTVKQHQATLNQDLHLFFDPVATDVPWRRTDWRDTQTMDYGHGRIREVRILACSTDLTDYLRWPALAQVLRVERTWREPGHRKRAVHDAITSLPPARATPAQLLALKRGHRQIENRLHWCKDVTLREDASLMHAGNGPRITSCSATRHSTSSGWPASHRSRRPDATTAGIPSRPSPSSSSRCRLAH